MRKIWQCQRWLASCVLLLGAFNASATLTPSVAQADVKVPNIFSDHMVLQREQANRVWGTADAGEKITVTIGEQKLETAADPSGKWEVKLNPLDAGGPYELKITGNNTVTISDVLVGEVWICPGQSNMQWSVNASNDADLEKLAAKNT
jgi:sialate O-acetylesterase